MDYSGLLGGCVVMPNALAEARRANEILLRWLKLISSVFSTLSSSFDLLGAGEKL